MKPPKLVRLLSVLELIEKCPPAGELPVAEYVPFAVVHIASPVSVADEALSAHEFCNGSRLITSTASGSNRVSGIALSGNGKQTPLLKHEKKSHTTLNPGTCPWNSPFLEAVVGSTSVACHVPLAGLISITAVPPSQAATIEKGC